MSTAETTETQVEGIQIGDKIYESPDDFTIGEAEVIKENTGLTPQELIIGTQQDPTDPTYLRALAWTVLHREKSSTEWDDKRITTSSIAAFFQIPEANGDANPPGSRRKKSSSDTATT